MLSAEVAHYLAAQALGLVVGTNLFSAPWPDTAPDAAACVIVYDGDPPSHAAGASLAAPVFETLRFKVMVRGARDAVAVAEALADGIYKKLDGLAEGQLGSPAVRYLLVRAMGGVEFLRLDTNSRPIYHCDFEARKERS